MTWAVDLQSTHMMGKAERSPIPVPKRAPLFWRSAE